MAGSNPIKFDVIYCLRAGTRCKCSRPRKGAPLRRPGAPPDCPVIALVVRGQAVLFERNLRGTDYPAPHTVLATGSRPAVRIKRTSKRSSGPNPVTVLEEAFRVQ